MMFRLILFFYLFYSYQAFGFGLPVVTLPGEFIRGRGAKALYEHMGISDCIANSPEDYINIALNLGQKQELRSKISSKILERSELIFNDTGVIEDLIKFLQSVSISDLDGYTLFFRASAS